MQVIFRFFPRFFLRRQNRTPLTKLATGLSTFSRKSNIRKFSAVAAPGSSLKLSNIVFFEIHPKSVVASFVRCVRTGYSMDKTGFVLSGRQK